MFRSTPSYQLDVYVGDFTDTCYIARERDEEHPEDLTLDNIAIDPAFQASLYSRWDDAQKSSYITSLIRGMAPSKYIFADIESCYKAAVRDQRPKDIEYFGDWMADLGGARYLNIDSNNRVVNLKAFVDGKFGAERGEYYTDSQNYCEVGKGTDTYNELHSDLRDMFNRAEVSIQIYTECTREELSELFCRINDGKPLNHPEKRNALTTPLAVVIRNLAKTYNGVFTHPDTGSDWFKRDDRIRRGVDDFIAAMAYDYFKGGDLKYNDTPSTLLAMYTNHDGKANLKAHEFERTFKTFMREVMDHSNTRTIGHKNLVFDLWHVWLQQRHLRVGPKNGKFFFHNREAQQKFIRTYLKATGELIALSKLGVLHNNPTWTTPKNFQKLMGGRQPMNNLVRNELITDMLLQEERQQEGLGWDAWFGERPPREKGRAKANTRHAAASRSDFRTRDNKEMDLAKLQTPDYHNGHIVPNADGGDSSLGNTVIQTKEDNLKLGRKQVDLEDVA